MERLITESIVARAAFVGGKGQGTECVVKAASPMGRERRIAERVVAETVHVAVEGLITDGRVVAARDVTEESECSIGGVAEPNGVAKKRSGPGGISASAVLRRSAPAPTPVQNCRVESVPSEKKPTAVLYVPPLRCKRAEAPSAVFSPG